MTEHQKRMQHIKETDPILYYELTSDPTGVSGNAGCGTVCWLILIILLIVAFHGIF